MKNHKKLYLIELSIILLVILASIGLYTIRKHDVIIPTFKEDINDPSIEVAVSDEIFVPFGMYYLESDYDYSDAPKEHSFDIKLQVFSGSEVGTDKHALVSDPMRLLFRYKHLKQLFFIKSIKSPSDKHISVFRENDGGTIINSIQIVECKFFYILPIICTLIFFFIIDIFVLAPGRMRDKLLSLLIALVPILLCSLPFMRDFAYDGDDFDFHVPRFQSLARELANGYFPVRYDSYAYDGAGYLEHIFYGNVFMYIPAILYLLKIPAYICYNVFCIVINISTYVIAYIAGRICFKEKKWGILWAYMYTLAPYRIQNVLYRAAMGEVVAMIFLPLFIAGIWKLIYSEDHSFRSKFLLAMSVTGMIQSHAFTCQMVCVFLLPFVIIEFRKVFEKETFGALMQTIGLVIALNLFFIVPFADSLRNGIPFDVGFEISEMGNGVAASILFALLPERPGYSLGFALMCGCILFIYLAIKRRMPKHIWLCFSLGLIAVFMVSEWMPWNAIHDICAPLHDFLKMVQYPYRYMAIVSALLVPVCVYGVRGAEEHFKPAKTIVSSKNSDNHTQLKSLTSMYSIFIILALISSLIMIFGVDKTGLERSVSSYDESEFCMDHLYLMEGVEYSDLIDNQQFATVTSNADIYANFCQADGSRKLITLSNMGEAGYIDVPIWAYRNLVARDTQSKDILTVSKSRYNTLRINIPANFRGTIEILYKEPVLWKICNAISLLTFIATMIFYCNSVKSHPTPHACV